MAARAIAIAAFAVCAGTGAWALAAVFLIVFLVLVAVTPKSEPIEEVPKDAASLQSQSEKVEAPVVKPVVSSKKAESLAKLLALRAEGVLTEEEFQRMKARHGL